MREDTHFKGPIARLQIFLTIARDTNDPNVFDDNLKRSGRVLGTLRRRLADYQRIRSEEFKQAGWAFDPVTFIWVHTEEGGGENSTGTEVPRSN